MTPGAQIRSGLHQLCRARQIEFAVEHHDRRPSISEPSTWNLERGRDSSRHDGSGAHFHPNQRRVRSRRRITPPDLRTPATGANAALWRTHAPGVVERSRSQYRDVSRLQIVARHCPRSHRPGDRKRQDLRPPLARFSLGKRLRIANERAPSCGWVRSATWPRRGCHRSRASPIWHRPCCAAAV